MIIEAGRWCSAKLLKLAAIPRLIISGADGLIIEIHPQPDHSLSDAQQTISFEAFAEIMRQAGLIRQALF